MLLDVDGACPQRCPPRGGAQVVMTAAAARARVCRHRGELLGLEDCECASPQSVHACARHGACTATHRVVSPADPSLTVVALAAGGGAVMRRQACRGCPDFMPPEPTEPVSPGQWLPPIRLPRLGGLPTGERCVLAIAPDAWSQEQLAITLPTLAAYAARCNAQLLIVTTNAYPHWPIANKYLAAQVASGFEQTLYVDCDVVVRPSAPDLFRSVPVGSYGLVDAIPTVTALGSLAGYLQQAGEAGEALGIAGTPPRVPNTGVMILPRDSSLYAPPDRPMPAWWCLDEFLPAYRLLGQEYRSQAPDYRSKGPKYHCTWLDDRWNWFYLRPDWADGLDHAYFVHLAGCHDRAARLAHLARLVAI